MNYTKWILLAEDDVQLAELATRALACSILECDIVVACDGVEALDCLHHRSGLLTPETGNPVFILLDIKMPRMDGLEVLREIKSDTQLKSIPVIMFSSSRDQADISCSYQLGADAYVVKPLGFQKFSETLKQIGETWGASSVLKTQSPAPQVTVTPQM